MKAPRSLRLRLQNAFFVLLLVALAALVVDRRAR
jgi:hypothetical protein